MRHAAVDVMPGDLVPSARWVTAGNRMMRLPLASGYGVEVLHRQLDRDRPFPGEAGAPSDRA